MNSSPEEARVFHAGHQAGRERQCRHSTMYLNKLVPATQPPLLPYTSSNASSIFRYLRIRLANTATAEDFTSETFLRAWRKLPDFRPELGSFTGWLYTIANNLVRDHRKSSGYRRELLDGEHHDRPDPAQEVDLLALSRIEAGTLRRYLGELSDLQRECLLLRFFAGLSVAEVATMMNKKYQQYSRPAA
ncbi:RNA polymerase sigma factor [Amycolatopsis sp. 3B14]|uniref:RNA polymerase sigma factor n=1 Tax=Amycolatopsis sp. 3B14 TaxID=3243600 RepID=UPI003D970408